RDRRVAADVGFTNQVGTITAIFYSEEIPQGLPDKQDVVAVRSSTQVARQRPVQHEPYLGADHGLVLCAMTLFYRSSEEMKSDAQLADVTGDLDEVSIVAPSLGNK